MDIALFVIVFSTVATLIFFNVYQRAKQLRALIDQGAPIQGQLIAKRRFNQKGRQRRVLSYEYNADGATRKGRSFVSAEEFDAHTEGQSIALRYLPDRPAVSAPEFVVEKATRK